MIWVHTTLKNQQVALVFKILSSDEAAAVKGVLAKVTYEQKHKQELEANCNEEEIHFLEQQMVTNEKEEEGFLEEEQTEYQALEDSYFVDEADQSSFVEPESPEDFQNRETI
jgi:hypothetical protein